MRTARRWVGTVALIVSVARFSAEAMAEPESTRSAPPDRTPYVRPAVPEDIAPFGKPAIGPKVVPRGRETTKGPPSPGATSGEKRKHNVKGEKNHCATQGE
jgi:hypothetical protein